MAKPPLPPLLPCTRCGYSDPNDNANTQRTEGDLSNPGPGSRVRANRYGRAGGIDVGSGVAIARRGSSHDCIRSHEDLDHYGLKRSVGQPQRSLPGVQAGQPAVPCISFPRVRPRWFQSWGWTGGAGHERVHTSHHKRHKRHHR